jgi:hypothetical protein
MYKTIVKNIIITEEENADILLDFTTKMNEYGINSDVLHELGFEYAVEICNGSTCFIKLFAHKDDAIELLKNKYDIFCLSNEITDRYMRDDECYAYADTADENYSYHAEIVKI